MKKLSIYIIALITIFFFFSCTGGKVISNSKNEETSLVPKLDNLKIRRDVEQLKMKQAITSIECPTNNECSTTYECYHDILKHKDYIYNHKLNKLIDCSIALAKQGDIEVEKSLVEYFENVYVFLRESIENDGVSNSLFDTELKQLRSPEAFEVAMKYARHGQWNDHYDDIVPYHSGVSYIESTIAPMIKTIDGKSYDQYFNYHEMFFKGYECTDAESCQKMHDYIWNSLNDAWKEGKIVLKKYGEE